MICMYFLIYFEIWHFFRNSCNFLWQQNKLLALSYILAITTFNFLEKVTEMSESEVPTLKCTIENVPEHGGNHLEWSNLQYFIFQLPEWEFKCKIKVDINLNWKCERKKCTQEKSWVRPRSRRAVQFITYKCSAF